MGDLMLCPMDYRPGYSRGANCEWIPIGGIEPETEWPTIIPAPPPSRVPIKTEWFPGSGAYAPTETVAPWYAPLTTVAPAAPDVDLYFPTWAWLAGGLAVWWFMSKGK